MKFKSGDHVKWNQFEGYVNFVSSHYISITLGDKLDEYPRTRINSNPREVNLICYNHNWKEVKKINE